MKYITERSSFNRKEIIKGLYKSVKNGEISMNITPDEFIHRSLKSQNPEIGTFESMVKSGFVSMSDEQRMGNILKGLKN